jgi:hypothetical protein
MYFDFFFFICSCETTAFFLLFHASTIPSVSVLNLLALFASVASTLISVMQLVFARMELMFGDRNRARLSITPGQPQVELGTIGVLALAHYYSAKLSIFDCVFFFVSF